MSTRKRIAIVFGTRPEAIKMLPVVLAAREASDWCEALIVNSGQHLEMTNSVLNLFGIEPTHDFAVMRQGQTLSELTTRLIQSMDLFVQDEHPDAILVHGDTTTAFACALVAFYHRIPVGHVEAGLRTYDLDAPFPEEMNRCFVDVVSQWYFAPTQTNRHNLINAGVPDQRVFVTGNTVIDAAQIVAQNLRSRQFSPSFLASLSDNIGEAINGGQFVLITAHRRENFGEPFQGICRGIRAAAKDFPDTIFLYPVHLNPRVREIVFAELSSIPNVVLTEPLDYESFMWLLDRCKVALTDSGGIQEEGPALGKRCLVMRDTTERPEVLETGWGELVGTVPARIHEALTRSLHGEAQPNQPNPFGDGTAGRQILNILNQAFQSDTLPPLRMQLCNR